MSSSAALVPAGSPGSETPTSGEPLAAQRVADQPAASLGITASVAASPDAPIPVARRRDFAHESEAEMARILDFYAVEWEYEPHTFPILWNLDGDVVESFAPDFYLPEIDLYLEMTTLRQKLVRKKNRKLRRLRELYPAIQIKLFYARDFRALMLKYGKLALAESLSGTVGQVGFGAVRARGPEPALPTTPPLPTKPAPPTAPPLPSAAALIPSTVSPVAGSRATRRGTGR